MDIKISNEDILLFDENKILGKTTPLSLTTFTVAPDRFNIPGTVIYVINNTASLPIFDSKFLINENIANYVVDEDIILKFTYLREGLIEVEALGILYPELTTTEAPAITGTPNSEEELTCGDGTYSFAAPTITKQWYIDGVIQDTETNDTFTVPVDSEDAVVSCRVIVSQDFRSSLTFEPSVTIVEA